MAEFISTFITGFQDVVAKNLAENLSGCKILGIFDGLVHYSYSGDSRNLGKIVYLSNTFFVLKTVRGKGAGIPALVAAVASEKKYYLINKGTFRVRFMQENQFVRVDKSLARRAEETVLANSRLRIDRVSPDTEIWYSVRREGFAFCGQLIFRREFTEKNLSKGELRPEIASLLCCFADINADDVIYDPFCGFGSIPVQIAKGFRFKRLLASDIDSAKVELVSSKKPLAANACAEIFVQDALCMERVDSKSVDAIITDPPWGFYEDIGDMNVFYGRMFASFARILKSGGKAVILSARTQELEKSAASEGFVIERSLRTLVNGKKASVYLCRYIG